MGSRPKGRGIGSKGLIVGLVWPFLLSARGSLSKNPREMDNKNSFFKSSLFSEIAKNKIVLMILVVLCLIAYCFYVRPAQIRTVCATEVNDKKIPPTSEYWQRAYSACLKTKGFSE